MLRQIRLRLVLTTAAAFIVPVILAYAASAAEHHNAPGLAIDGEIRVVHIDEFERDRSRTVYFVRDSGSDRVYELKFERGAPRGLKTGQNVIIRGRAVGRALWVDDISTAGANGDGTGSDGGEVAGAATTGDRRAILMVVNLDTAPGYYGDGTADAGGAKLFGATFSVNSVYRQASFGQLAFPGDRTMDVVILEGIPFSSGCSFYTYAGAADAAAQAAGIDLSPYHHKVYLLPPKSISDCSWLALGEVGSYGGSSARRSWSTRNDAVAYAHEIGHNLGWHHAATDTNNDLARDSEYGDTSDIMGYCCSHRAFNAAHVDQIGWLDPIQGNAITVVTDGVYDLAPLGADPGLTDFPQVLRIDRLDSTEDYVLSYRQPIGHDANLGSGYLKGVNIHHARRTGNWSYFIRALGDGGSFSDTASGITITQLSHGAESVSVQIAFDNCIVKDPSVAVGPSSQVVSGNVPVGYTATVTNNDSLGCDNASFNLSASLSGLSGGLSSSAVTLAPGESVAAALSVDAVGDDGSYAIAVAAADSERLRNDGTGTASLLIDTTPPAPPTGLATGTKKVRGSKSVRISWTAAGDGADGSGVVSYSVFRDGAWVGDTSSLSFADPGASPSGSYTYWVTAHDAAGHQSDPSEGALYVPDGGGTKGNGWGKGGKKLM